MSQSDRDDHWHSKKYADKTAFVAELGSTIYTWLAPTANESILDLGCGDGSLTFKIAQSGAQVLGVDSSHSMVASTQDKGLEAQVMDATNLSFEARFDAIFSNAALHWMKSYQAVITNVYKSLKPKGRFVAEMGGDGNIASLVQAIDQVFAANPEYGSFNNPWFFPSADLYSQALEDAGFVVDNIELVERMTPLDSGMTEWLKVFTSAITQSLSESQKLSFYQQVTDQLKSKRYSAEQGWTADYVRLRFIARKP